MQETELFKFNVYKEKLMGICDENFLTSSFRQDKYPITLTIRPIAGKRQMELFEEAEEISCTSQDAAIVFSYEDGELTYKTSETFTISEALFNKIKNIYKNMLFLWLQIFFRDVIDKTSKGIIAVQDLPTIEETGTEENGEAGEGEAGETETDTDLSLEGIEQLEIDDIDNIDDETTDDYPYDRSEADADND